MFTIEELIGEVRRLTKENPDYIYNAPEHDGCSYISSKDDPHKGCIFGQAMLNLDPDLHDTLDKFDTYGIPYILRDVLNVSGTDRQYDWCAMFQRKQDTGHMWGEALAYVNSIFVKS